MDIDEINDMWIKDSVIDETELSEASLNIPKLHSKYLKLFSNEKLRLKKQFLRRKEIQKKLMEYYRGELNHPEDLKEIGREPCEIKVLKQDLQYYVDNDQEMIDINIRISYQEVLVETLTEIIKTINNRGYVIKNSIDFLRFTQGGI